jgi:hypothetical protein
MGPLMHAGGPGDKRRPGGVLHVAARGSGRGGIRGHLVGHSAGRGLDINVIPIAALDRGPGAQGRGWRAVKTRGRQRPGRPLFVRAAYRDAGCTLARLDFGVLMDGALRMRRFDDTDDGQRPGAVRTSRASAGSRCAWR